MIKTEQKNHVYLLIETDGYSIATNEFDSLSDAQKEMNERYEWYYPKEGLDEDCEEQSHISDLDALLFVNGMGVFVWKIVKIGVEQ